MECECSPAPYCLPPPCCLPTPEIAVYPCPGPQAIPTIPSGVPPCPVNPQNVCVATVKPGVVTIVVPQKKKKCKYIQPARPKNFAPLRKFKPPELQMSDNTIYRKSYLPCENERACPVRPRPNICIGTGKFTKDTVNKMSYQYHKDALPPCAIYPCNHKLLGEGPIQDITTNKHDYVPKHIIKAFPIRPSPNLYPSECPLSDKTTNRLSYMPVDTAKSRRCAIRPIPALPRPCGPFEKNTVQKMSYMPWEPQEPIDMPWAAKKKFSPPTLRMSDNTVNRLSYAPPGIYVECDDDDPYGVDCPEQPCNANQGGGGADPCSLPCCCPTAGC